MEPAKIQKIIARIQQLRAISQSTHSKAEAETTLQIAAKLIAEYQVSEAELQASGKGDDTIDLDSESIIYESGRLRQWKHELARGIANLIGLFIYNAIVRNAKTHRKGNRYRIIGRKSDVEIALYMMSYLVSEIERLVVNYIPVGQHRGINPERESWSLGCVHGFLTKMQDERDAVNKTATSTALIFIGNKAKEAENAWKVKTGNRLSQNNYKPQGQCNYDTFQAGYQQGQKFSINAGLKPKI